MIKLTISYKKTLDDGSQKNITEQYLTDEKTHSDAEKRIQDELLVFIGEYEVKSSVKSNYQEIILTDGTTFYCIKAAFVTIDEKSGKEKAKKFNYLVSANTLEEAIVTFKKYMADSVTDYNLLSVQETGIVECYQ